MICAWIDTSSAVVGSSAMISLRLGGERQRDHHALPHPARELVRIVVDPPRRRRNADFFQEIDRARRAPPVPRDRRCVRIVSMICRPIV